MLCASGEEVEIVAGQPQFQLGLQLRYGGQDRVVAVRFFWGSLGGGAFEVDFSHVTCAVQMVLGVRMLLWLCSITTESGRTILQSSWASPASQQRAI